MVTVAWAKIEERATLFSINTAVSFSPAKCSVWTCGRSKGDDDDDDDDDNFNWLVKCVGRRPPAKTSVCN